MPVLETDFILGLRKGDKKHETCQEILRMFKMGVAKELSICGSGFTELAIGLRGRLTKTEIAETLRNIRAIISGMPEAGLTSAVLLRGVELEEELAVTNLFDCLHAATALEQDSVIVSDDKFFDSISTLRRISLDAYVKQLK